MKMRAPGLALLVALAVATPASALTIAVAAGAPQITLRVGQTGGTISLVTFTVPAASAGNGVPIDGVSNAASRAAQAVFPACAAGVRIWARARSTLALPRVATLSVNSSGSMISGANSIPFTNIDWVTSGGVEIPSGVFSGAASQNLMTINTSNEVSVCLQYRFLNATVYPAGTYNGQLTYNLAMP